MTSVSAAVDPTAADKAADEKPSRWSTQSEWFDWLVLAATGALAALTVWVGSSVVRGMWDYIFVSLLWSVVGAAWCATVLVRTTDIVARLAMAALILGSILTVAMFGPITALVLWIPSDWFAVSMLVVVPLTLFLVKQRPIRLVWFVAPGTVMVAVAIVLSGVAAAARFAAAEPELTRYVQSLNQGAAMPDYNQPITVGGVPVVEVLHEGGQTLLVTGFIGILGDDPAGLAFVPDGRPVGVDWQHINGPWYRWVPLGYGFN